MVSGWNTYSDPSISGPKHAFQNWLVLRHILTQNWNFIPTDRWFILCQTVHHFNSLYVSSYWFFRWIGCDMCCILLLLQDNMSWECVPCDVRLWEQYNLPHSQDIISCGHYVVLHGLDRNETKLMSLSL